MPEDKGKKISITAPKVESKDFAPQLVKSKSDIPNDAVLMTDDDGSQYYQLVTKAKGEEKKDTPRKPTPTTGIRVPGKYKPKPPTDDSSGWHGETIRKWKIEPTNSDKEKADTVINSEVETIGRRDDKLTANQDWDTYNFANEDGNSTNQAIKESFVGDKHFTFDKDYNKVFTGKTLNDFRNNSISRINQYSDSGVNKANPKVPNTISDNTTNFTRNAGGGAGIINSNTPSVYVPKKYDSLGKEVLGVESGIKTDIPVTPVEEVGKMRPLVKAPPMKKGGVVGSVKGYYLGGTTYDPNKNIDGTYGNSNSSTKPLTKTGNYEDVDYGAVNGVVGQNDQYAAAKKEEEVKTKKEFDTKGAVNTVASGLGAYGSAYYASKPRTSDGDNLRSTALGTVSGMGAIGGVVGGVAGIADQLAKPTKDRSEQLNDKGEVKDEARAKENMRWGTLFSPSQRLTYKGGLTDVSGDAYIESLEKDRKAELKDIADTNNQSKQQQAIAARNAGDFNAIARNQYDPLTGEPIAYKKGGIVQSLQDGGVIKGKGTGKSDSINAKIEGGSFVVPAENAKTAEMLRAKLLKSPPKTKANLNQKGETPVKLSNGEHLFTPEEKEELLERGVDVNLLAPNADNKEEKKEHMVFPKVVGLKEGGDVDAKKEQAKIDAERKAITDANKKLANEKAIMEYARKTARAKFDAQKERESKIKEWEKKTNDSKSNLDALNKSYEDAVNEFNKSSINKSDKLLGVEGVKNKEYQRKTKEDLLNKINKAKSENDNAKRTYDYVKNDDNYKAKTPSVKEGTTVIPNKTGESVAVNPKTGSGMRVPKSTNNTYTTPQVVDNGEGDNVIVPGDKLSPNERAIANANEKKASADAKALNESAIATGITPESMAAYNQKAPAKNGWMNKIGNIDPTMFLGAGQAAMGYNMLKGEVRPVDKAVIDSTYNANVNRSIADAQFGLTPEQKFLAEQEVQNGLNDDKFAALNTSGGNGVQAYNLTRDAVNNSWKARLGIKEADTNLRMQKQQYADAQVANRAGILAQNRRMLFNDTMDTFQQKQQAGGELVSAGLMNTIDSYRFNRSMQQRDAAEKAKTEYTGKI